MKTCSKCGFEGDDELFVPRTCRCKTCHNNIVKEWRKNNPDKVKATAKRFRTNHPDRTKESYAKWKSQNIEHLKKYRKEKYFNNIEKEKEDHMEWKIKNAEHIKAYRKRVYDEDPDKAKRRHKVWLATISGKKHLRKYNHQRRGLGHNPLNEFFEGSDEHHLRYSNSQEDKDNDMTIYVPRELHRSIPHNGNTGKNMREINIACLEWYFANTPVENRNKKAVDLYLKYCMLPEPQWVSEQTTA